MLSASPDLLVCRQCDRKHSIRLTGVLPAEVTDLLLGTSQPPVVNAQYWAALAGTLKQLTLSATVSIEPQAISALGQLTALEHLQLAGRDQSEKRSQPQIPQAHLCEHCQLEHFSPAI